MRTPNLADLFARHAPWRATTARYWLRRLVRVGSMPDAVFEVAAVTGTSGKTSVAEFTRQIWHHGGRPATALGTLGLVGEGLDRRLAHTTPDPVTLHEILAEVSAAGVEHLAIEASSHGLDQCRMDAVEVNKF